MKHFLYIYTILLLLMHALPLTAQTEDAEAEMPEELTPAMRVEMTNRIQEFTQQMSDMRSSIPISQIPQLKNLQKLTEALDMKWNIWYQNSQALISQDESIVELVVAYQQTKESVMDSINSRKNFIQALDRLKYAERLMNGQDSVYKHFENESQLYSLSPKTAPQLENLKAKEQLLFTDIQKAFEEAKSAAGTSPSFASRMTALEERFIAIKTRSEHIQAAQYVPFIQRIKDYIMSIAAVSIIIMFITFIIMRLQALKKARKAAEDMKKMLDGQNQEYPSI